MAQRTAAAQSEHDRIVEHVAKRFLEQGASDVRADRLRGFDPPDRICHPSGEPCHDPDVTANRNGQFVVVEVETEDSLDSDHTASQLTLFDLFVAGSSNRRFELIVPASCTAKAREVATRLGLRRVHVAGVEA